MLFNMYGVIVTTIKVYLRWYVGCRKSLTHTHTLTLCILLLYKLEGQYDVLYE
jgi:hypothetical protein